MKYVRTLDGRIIEESRLEPDFKKYILTLRNKKDNKVIDILKMDYVADTKKLNLIEAIVFANYCAAHKLDARDIIIDRELLRCNNVIATADTIGELCDGLVIIPKNKKVCPFTRRFDDYDFIPTQQEFVEAVYGAIYIEGKGIIFVAKLNDKGELELL